MSLSNSFGDVFIALCTVRNNTLQPSSKKTRIIEAVGNCCTSGYIQFLHLSIKKIVLIKCLFSLELIEKYFI
jgi:hypothetical protein